MPAHSKRRGHNQGPGPKPRRGPTRWLLPGALVAAAACAHPDGPQGLPVQGPSLSEVLSSLLGEASEPEPMLATPDVIDAPWSGAAFSPSAAPGARPAATPSMQLAWPVAASGVTSAFGPRAHPLIDGIHFHYGVDLEARSGDPVAAPAHGVVRDAGWRGRHGYRVVIQHPGDYVTVFSHLSTIWVETGEPVELGEVFALVGSTGASTGPHLHLEVTHNGRHVDPLRVLGASLAAMRQAPQT